MHVLLDEMLDRCLKRLLAEEHEVLTVRDRGWGAKTNGELLELAQQEFDVLVTADRGIPDQQNLPLRPFGGGPRGQEQQLRGPCPASRWGRSSTREARSGRTMRVPG